MKLNTFVARANFAINATSRNGGHDWYCPKCDRFYEWDDEVQRFDDITLDWIGDYRVAVVCADCDGPVAPDTDNEPPGYACPYCDTMVPADLAQIRRASLDPLA